MPKSKPAPGRRPIEAVIFDCDGVLVDSEPNPKPHLEPYQRASDLLGVPTDRCVVVEDSVLGYQSAKAAECSVVVLVSESETAPTERFPGARAFATSVDDASGILGAMVDGAAAESGGAT